MNDDIATLFERAEREIRPAFKQELRDLFEDAGPVLPAAALEPFEFSTEPVPQPRSHASYQQLLAAAVTVLFVAGLAVLSQSRDHPSSTSTTSNCSLAAEEIGVVDTPTVEVRVGLMPDGHTFCLVDDGDGSSLGPTPTDDLLVNASAVWSSPETASVVEQGVLSATTRWYVVDIPDGMPVASVSAGERLPSFPTRSGRRLLVVDVGLDAEQTDVVTRELNLYSSTGVVLATVLVQVDPLGSTLTSSTSKQGEPP